MTGGVEIRPVSRSDYEAWLHLWDGYNAFYERVGPTALAPEVTRTTWERFFDAYEPMHALVAEVDDRLAGLVHYLFHRNTIMLGPACYLQDLFTDPGARGNGIGKARIHAVYDQAKAAGSTGVYWHTHETNETAMKLYDTVADRTGFIMYRRAF